MEIKAAILGAGNMGKSHAKRLLESGALVSCVCDRSRTARRTFIDEMQREGVQREELEKEELQKKGIQQRDIQEFEDFNEMLDEGDFDVLFICLPPFAQDHQFERAAERGKHIFIEKPIALNTDTGRRMVKSAEENGIITRVGFHMRQGTAVRKMKELITSGEAGRPVLFHGHYSCNSLHTPWWINVDLCGGQIYEQAIHVYDLCRYLMGEPKFAAGVMGNVCHNHIHNYTVEDVSASFAGFTNGAVAAITANNCEIPGEWVGSFKVVYEKVTAEFRDFNHAVFTYTGESEIRTEIIDSQKDAYLDEVKEFLECVKEKRQTICDIKEVYKSLCYVETVVESAGMDGVKIGLHK